VASASSIAQAFAARSRELVPTRWAALLVQAGHQTSSDGRQWSMLGYDGDAPAVLLSDRRLRLAQLADQVPGATILPIEFSPTMLAAVCVGPRLDGMPLGGVDVETIQMVARAALPSTEAALLREQSEEAASFRRGLSQLARELAAVGAVRDVLRVSAEHAASLVGADSAVVWLRETRGGSMYVSLDALNVTDTLELGMRLDLHSLLGPELAMRLRYERIARGSPDCPGPMDARDLRCVLVCRLGEWSASDTLLMLVRNNRERPFTSEDEQRVAEIAEHADGALRRAHVSDQAAEAEALRELNRLRGELMSMVAHELRGPLTAVLGYAQLLRQRAESLPPASIVRMADQIERSARLTNDIVRDLSTTTLHDAGRLAVRAENVDLGAALAAIAHSFQVLPGGDRLRVEVAEGVCARADPARIEQMVGNLLFNALRYAPNGPVVLRGRPGGANEVWVEVCDQGPGISADLHPQIWEKFYRVAGSEHVTQGTGIGLAVVRTLAELHGGHVELESSPGVGSTFRIVLPRADA
jgi:signal transduction histidine kinase